MLDLPKWAPTKKKKIKTKVYTTVLIRETEGLFRERVGRGIHLLQSALGKMQCNHTCWACLTSNQHDNPSSHLLVCLFTSCSVSFHISPLISPERPANSGGFSVGIKNGLTAVMLNRHRSATSSRNKGLFHYLFTGASSGSYLFFIWRAAEIMQNPHWTIRPRLLKKIKTTYWAIFWNLPAGFLNGTGKWKPVKMSHKRVHVTRNGKYEHRKNFLF